MSSVSLKNITKVYNKNVTVIKNMNLEIKDKEFIILVGPSGCGKSTLLRIIAGLEGITEGEIFIGDKNVTQVPPKDRDISMVFQNYALYPHMTVYKNMAFGLENRKIQKDEIKKKIKGVAKILDIENLLDRKPKAMSGGQQQRVALGRAMVREPNVFLLDEPLSNLDAKLRTSMRSEIVKLHNRVNTTFVYVTHDQVEAMTMGDRIVIMKDGYIQQIGTPKEIYDTPKNKFVAGFIGTPRMNFFNVTWKEKEKNFYLVNDEGKEIIFPLNAKDLSLKSYDNKQIILGIRPEHITFTQDSKGITKVDMVEHLGSESYIHLNLFGYNVIMKTSGYSKLVRNDKINIQFSEANFNLFDVETEKVIK